MMFFLPNYSNTLLHLHHLILTTLVLLTLQINRLNAATTFTCSTDEDCIRQVQTGSFCNLETMTCTNPYASGCLLNVNSNDSYNADIALNYTAARSGKRICNSDDDPYLSSNLCEEQDSRLNYLEIRVSPGDWESSLFFAWINQILLSEFLGVPVTIETSGGGPASFYDEDLAMSYAAIPYNYDALREANAVDCNCSLSDKVSKCVAVLLGVIA